MTQLSFFNTIHLSGNGLKEAQEQTGLQDIRVLALFREYKTLTPFQAHETYCERFPECPVTSIRRSITVLTKKGLLIKTNESKIEKYGKKNYYWRSAESI